MVALKHKVSNEFLQEEVKSLLVSSSMKEIWAVELDLLSEFDAACKKYNLRYVMTGGGFWGRCVMVALFLGMMI